MAKIFAPADGAVGRRELEHMNAVREIAAGGMVLLENDGTLPLEGADRKIALYGSGARRTIKGGTGSGDVNSRVVVSVEQGFENAGFCVMTKDWLDQYDAFQNQAMAQYVKMVKQKAEETKVNPLFITFMQPFKAPDAEPVGEQDLAEETDTAVYVLSRNSGEGADRFYKEGDYLLSQTEIADITFLAEKYEKFIVLLNVGAVIDTKPFRAIPGINAVLLMSQAGNVGGDAVVDVLTGKVSPSGKLADTWAENYGDYPASAEFSHNNGNLDDSYYEEGIYVGYRYFDTFGVTPAYCFGYGRSYTDFAIDTLETAVQGDTVTVTVQVTNIGKKYAGREVVQVYTSAPTGKLEKPYQELRAYQKTGLLAPGAVETLKLSFAVSDMASYDETSACRILEKGEYIVRVGNSSRNTGKAAVLKLDTEVKTEILKNLFGKAELAKELKQDGTHHADICGQEEKTSVPVLTIDAANIKARTAEYAGLHEELPKSSRAEKLTMDDVRAGRASLEELVSQLTAEEMATLCVGTARGADMGNVVGTSSAAVPGAAGDTTSLMIEDRNIRNMILADGPAGLRLQPVFHSRNGELVKENFFAMPGLEELMPEMPKPDLTGATEHYQYCTAIPIATLLAQTWDVDAIRAAGDMIGSEMETFGVTLWLAPGMNIHRDPLCGRNFEYYSEDPLVAGLCAAAATQGVQSHKGVGTTIKHFALNNQEDNRLFNNSHVSERALREIYLRGFEICVRKAQPLSMMSSYNLLNGVHTANCYDLLTAAARDEWGFAGLIMTDWGTTEDGLATMMPGQKKKYGCSHAAECVKAGNDLIMPGSQKDVDDILAALGKTAEETEHPLTLGELQWCAKNILSVLKESSCYQS